MRKSAPSRVFKVCVVFTLSCAIGCIFLIDKAQATVDAMAHWPVEVAESWNSVYGSVTGISLEDGDSVGMFDTEGNCYGAGLIKGGRYFLSAFQWEEEDPTKPNDFTIQGFRDGDTVIFKAYKRSTGQEYYLVATSGTYNYSFAGEYPPVRIDLAYDEDFTPPSPGEEVSPEEEEGSRVVGGGVILTSGGEAEESEAAKAEEKVETAEVTEEVREEEKSRTETYQEYGPSDIIYRDRGAREPSTAARPAERRVLPGREGEEPAYREKEAEEIVLAEAPGEAPEGTKEEPAKKKLPIVVKISFLFLILIILLIVIFKKLKVL